METVPLILFAILLNFTIINLSPGDPALILAGEMADQEYVNRVREEFGLNKPLVDRLIVYIQKAVTGDFGNSYFYRQPVLKLIIERIPATLLLSVIGLFFTSVIGIVIGVVSSTKPGSLTDFFLGSVSLIGNCMPIFWLGQIMIIVFSLQLALLPSQGMISVREELTGIAYLIDLLSHLILPGFCLGMFNLAMISRITRASMIETLKEHFIVTARAKGLHERIVVWKHAFKNALLPVITMIGYYAGYLLAGAIITETVFSWPGLGRLMYDSISSRDYPVLMGMLIITSIMVITANIVTDIICAFLDPRIRYR